MGSSVPLSVTGVKNPPEIDGVQQPIITDPTSVKGKLIPLEIEGIAIPDTRTPSYQASKIYG